MWKVRRKTVELIEGIQDRVITEWDRARDDAVPSNVTLHEWMMSLLSALLSESAPCRNPFHTHVDADRFSDCYSEDEES